LALISSPTRYQYLPSANQLISSSAHQQINPSAHQQITGAIQLSPLTFVGRQIFRPMNHRNLFAFVLSALVLAITLLALLGIWDIIDWVYVQKYFWKSVQSLVLLLVCAFIIYLIYAILGKAEMQDERTSS